jgi:hypothetical protein
MGVQMTAGEILEQCGEVAEFTGGSYRRSGCDKWGKKWQFPSVTYRYRYFFICTADVTFSVNGPGEDGRWSVHCETVVNADQGPTPWNGGTGLGSDIPELRATLRREFGDDPTVRVFEIHDGPVYGLNVEEIA